MLRGTLADKEYLIEFEKEVAWYFDNAKIKAPIHLYSGNEDDIINVFKNIGKDDWVCCSWRSHYQCLLKGVPHERLLQDIIDGRSISLCYKEFKIVSSGIVGGILPIAVGMALDIKRSGGTNKVYCFMGDMTSETGITHECVKYSINHKLPIHFIVEDNEKSVCTPTKETWGLDMLSAQFIPVSYVTYYKYQTQYPHAGSGFRTQF